MNPSRVKILESKYEENKDLIIWTLHFIDTGDEQKFCWPSVDLMKAIGVDHKKVETHHLHQFCYDMIGKEINFVIEGIPVHNLPDTNSTEISEGISEHFDTFRMHADG